MALVATTAQGSGNGQVVTFSTPATTSAPTLTGASQTHTSWREGGALAQISRKRKPPVGTTFSFTLNEAASVRFDFVRVAQGRMSGRRCVPPTRRHAHARTCTRSVAAGSLVFSGHDGVNRVRFEGRLPNRTLTPAAYTLTISASAFGASATASALRFAIVKR